MKKCQAAVFLLGGSILALAGTARSEPAGPGVLPVHVITIQSEDADDQAEALTAALRSRVRAMRGYSLAESDFALEVLTLALKCAEVPDDSCQTKIGDHIHADRYLWGTVKRSKARRQVTADLHLWTRNRPPGRTQLTYSDNLTTPGDDALKRLVEDGLGKLFEAPKPPLAGSPAVAPVVLPPPNHADLTHPGAPPTDAVEETGGNGHRTTGWAAVGLGAGLLGAGVYSVIRVHGIDTDQRVELYREGFGANADICDQANAGVESKVPGAASPGQMRDFCSSATTFQTLQYVFFGLGAISFGAGAYLLATDKSGAPSSTARFRLNPSVSRSSGKLEMSLTF